MAITNLPNPYTFNRPADSKTFVGREKHLDEIRLSLNQGILTNRPNSVAITGDRASGKTSLLVMLRELAEEQGCCTARIELDDSTVENDAKFLNTLFDNVLVAACGRGAYGGLGETTYQDYLDILTEINTPADRSFLPFVFPLIYARMAKSGSFNVMANNLQIFQKDLEEIRDECARVGITLPIVVTIDECDVLGEKRSSFQQLRNLIQHIDGYMFAIAGTQRLLDSIDDVFSPVARQFTKIPLGPFDDVEETRRCIMKPLEYLDSELRKQSNPEEATQSPITELLQASRGPEFRDLVDDVHTLTGGRPYDIQLVSEVMFKQVQLGFTESLQLSSQVIEDAMEQMTGADRLLPESSIVSAVQSLSSREFRSLTMLYSLEEDSIDLDRFSKTFELTLALQPDYDFRGGLRGARRSSPVSRIRSNRRLPRNRSRAPLPPSWDNSRMPEICQVLEDKGILKRNEQDGSLTFNGDEREWIYLRYWSHAKDDVISANRVSVSTHLTFMLRAFASDMFNSSNLDYHIQIATGSFGESQLENGHWEQLATWFVEPGLENESKDLSPTIRGFDYHQFYGFLVGTEVYGPNTNVPFEMFNLTLKTPVETVSLDVIAVSKSGNDSPTTELAAKLIEFNLTHSDAEYSLSVERSTTYIALDPNGLADRLKLAIQDRRSRPLARHARMHSQLGADQYTADEPNLTMAEFHLKIAFDLSNAESANNYGYLLMAQGEDSQAIEVFEEGLNDTMGVLEEGTREHLRLPELLLDGVSEALDTWLVARNNNAFLDLPLLVYNLAVSYAKAGYFDKSKGLLRQLISNQTAVEAAGALCVFKPLVNHETSSPAFNYEEVYPSEDEENVNLYSIACEALNVLES